MTMMMMITKFSKKQQILALGHFFHRKDLIFFVDVAPSMFVSGALFSFYFLLTFDIYSFIHSFIFLYDNYDEKFLLLFYMNPVIVDIKT